ncbi:hypothetical protein KAJ27_13640 [bacterium]|nr:hypothetical protein [bacterium]
MIVPIRKQLIGKGFNKNGIAKYSILNHWCFNLIQKRNKEFTMKDMKDMKIMKLKDKEGIKLSTKFEFNFLKLNRILD